MPSVSSSNNATLFNGLIPIGAIQMRAYEVNDGVALTFTKVIDELELGEDDSTTIVKGTTTRRDYEESVPKQIMEPVDGPLFSENLCEMLRECLGLSFIRERCE